MRTCRWCYKELPSKPPGQPGPAKTYCDVSCKDAYWKEQREKKQRETIHHCRECGKEFRGGSNRYVYCSDKCSREYQRADKPPKKACEYCGEIYEPDPITAWKQRFCDEPCQRQWWQEKREEYGKVYTYTCENCGKEYETIFSNRDTCCSRECGWELISKRAQINKQCLICKETFEGTQSGSDYCSDKCRAIRYTHICIQCGDEFKTDHAANTLCSDECRRQRKREQYEQYKANKIDKIDDRQFTCKECNTKVIASYGDKRREFCSLKCNRKFGNRYRRMKKKANGKVQKISSSKVFDRDGWQCGICGKQVDPDLEFPHPKSVSLDHIVPLAKGGTHTWGNVQCAHLECNRTKSDTPIGQLRLGITHVSV